MRIHGEQIAVNAQIHNLEGFSGHADQMLYCIGLIPLRRSLKKFLVHGEPEGMEAFKNILVERYGIDVYTPEFNQSFDLKHGEVKVYDVKGPSEKDAALVYANIINKLSELYRINLERHELNQLYDKLKSIERAI